jgi:hypothetical protein
MQLISASASPDLIAASEMGVQEIPSQKRDPEERANDSTTREVK